MNGRERDHGPREKDSRNAPDLYQMYVQFEQRYALAALTFREPGWEQNAFLDTFHVRSKDEFEDYFQSINDHERQRLVKRWSLGYERYIETRARQFGRVLHEVSREVEEGLPPDVEGDPRGKG